MSSRFLALALAGIGLAVVLRLCFGNSSVGADVEASGHGADAPSESPVADLSEIESWSGRLGKGENLRVVAESGGEPEPVRTVTGLGRLAGGDLSAARAGVDRFVTDQKRRLDDHYATAAESWGSEEEKSFREAELLWEHYKAVAFLDAFDRGDYYLVVGYDERLPDPPGVISLNVGGVAHGDRHALLIVFVDKAKHGLTEVQEHVQHARRSWLSRLAYDFNAKPDVERRQLIQRFKAKRDRDKSWRKRMFPKGLAIDEEGWLLRLAGR